MGLRDLSQMDFLEDSDLLAQGFFADRVVDVLQKAEAQLTHQTNQS